MIISYLYAHKLIKTQWFIKCIKIHEHKQKTYINEISQFHYCPLDWMCHSRSLNNKINLIQERTLRIVYRDYNSSFKELIQKDKSITILQINLQYLGIEICKVKMAISSKIMNEIFRFSKSSVHSLISGVHSIIFNSKVNLQFTLEQKSGN